MNKQQKPSETFRIDRVKATVWANETKFGVRYNVTLSRAYKTESGKFEDTNSFDARDLLHVARAANQALDWIERQHVKPADELQEE
jgi:hypothetical protein